MFIAFEDEPVLCPVKTGQEHWDQFHTLVRFHGCVHKTPGTHTYRHWEMYNTGFLSIWINRDDYIKSHSAASTHVKHLHSWWSRLSINTVSCDASQNNCNMILWPYHAVLTSTDIFSASSFSPRSLCHAGHEADGASGETGPSEFPQDGKNRLLLFFCFTSKDPSTDPPWWAVKCVCCCCRLLEEGTTEVDLNQRWTRGKPPWF